MHTHTHIYMYIYIYIYKGILTSMTFYQVLGDIKLQSVIYDDLLLLGLTEQQQSNNKITNTRNKLNIMGPLPHL